MMHYVESFDWFECGDTFKVRQKLDYHIKAKHGPYICQECSKEESSAYRHMRKVHKVWFLQFVYIEIQGTTPNFCPKNLGILVSEMGQVQGGFGT